MPTASAIAEPDIPAKIMLATTLTWPRPPGSANQDKAKLQQPVGQAPDIHQIGRENEKRDCQKNVGVGQPVEDLLGGGSEIETCEQQIKDRACNNRVADRQTQRAK